MKITTTGRKCTLRPAFVERTETKLSKMDKFFDSAASADVTVSNERNKQRVEITIRCNGLLFRAEEAAEDPNEAVDKLVDVLLRQIRRNKTRLRSGCARALSLRIRCSASRWRKNPISRWSNPRRFRSSLWMWKRRFCR